MKENYPIDFVLTWVDGNDPAWQEEFRKYYRDSFSPPLRSGSSAPDGCYLVIFDRRPEAPQIPWSERLKWSKEGEVTIVGC